MLRKYHKYHKFVIFVLEHFIIGKSYVEVDFLLPHVFQERLQGDYFFDSLLQSYLILPKSPLFSKMLVFPHLGTISNGGLLERHIRL